MKYRKNQTKFTHKRALVLILVALLFVGAGGVWFYKSRQNNKTPTSTDTNPPGTEKIDLSPPTAEDKNAVDQHKEDLSNQKTSDPGSETENGKKNVIPTIVSVSKSEIRAYISGIVENGGTCTATATQGSQTVPASSTAFDNVSTTQCAPIPISLGAGAWSIVVSYSSPTATGRTQAKTYPVN